MPRTIWYFKKRLIALNALIIQDSIGLTEEQELVDKIPENIPENIPEKIPENIPDKIPGNIL